MGKKSMGPQPLLFPNPTIIIGADVDGKPNFATFAWAGIVAGNPPAVAAGLQHHRYTLKGIRQNMTFSVNIPSSDLLKETDYCGIISGTETDKAADCGFKVFYGLLKNAPLVEQCPVNLECEALHILNLGSHALVVGKIVETYASEDCLTDGKPDIMKIKPIIYSRGSTARYNAVGEVIGDAFSAGKELKVDKKD